MGADTKESLFDGLKILDFTWVGVGPITTKYFADHGANVIKIESVSRLDILRDAAPFKDGIPGINRSQFSGNYNSNKRNLGLNLSLPKTLELVKNIRIIPKISELIRKSQKNSKNIRNRIYNFFKFN